MRNLVISATEKGGNVDLNRSMIGRDRDERNREPLETKRERNERQMRTVWNAIPRFAYGVHRSRRTVRFGGREYRGGEERQGEGLGKGRTRESNTSSSR